MTLPARHTSRGLAALQAVAVTAVLFAPGAAAAFVKTFPKDSLIIPAQLEYQPGDQNSDGSIAAYGLVYTVLAKNNTRTRPITIYWVVEPTKRSHHRCDTATDDPPNYDTYNHNDGCDFAVESAAGQPVALIGPTGAEIAPFEATAIQYDPASGDVTRSNSTFTVGPDKSLVKYSGGAWVIDARDRNDFLLMLKNAEGPLAHFHANGTSSRHYVNIHSARNPFTAFVARAMNEKPPVVALVGNGPKQILESYLDVAGINNTNFPNREGTPGDREGIDGRVYDVLEPLTHFVTTSSFPCGAINALADATTPVAECTRTDRKRLYNVLWAADWKIDTASAYPRSFGSEANAKANALANIAAFVDAGNGLFAEDSSIISFEGTLQGSASCNVQQVCASATDPTQTAPFGCADGFQPSTCNACFEACPAGSVLDDSNCGAPQCVANCAPPAVATCEACYEPCGSGFKLDATNCSDVQCVSDTGTCPSGATAACGGLCFECPTVDGVKYELDASDCANVFCHEPCRGGFSYSLAHNVCYDCIGELKNNGKCPPGKTTYTPTPSSKLEPVDGIPATMRSVLSTTPDRSSPLCREAAFPNLICPGSSTVPLGGSEATRFQSTTGMKINMLNGAFSGPDCTDYLTPAGTFHAIAPGTGHDCVNYHPRDGAAALLFSQKGNFKFTGATGGNVQDYTPETYRSGTMRIVSSGWVNSSGSMVATSARAGHDFSSIRHKDGDPAKGLVVYLSGHQYKQDFWGLRIILNTLLNLGLTEYGLEIARSEPVGYRDEVAKTSRVYQGTYVELPTPPFDDWRQYFRASPHSWRFPFVKGHLYEYDLDSIAGAQDFGEKTNWDARARMPAPGDRKIFTVLGGSANLGWKRIPWTHEQVLPGCLDVDVDQKCDLAERLAEGGTAGVTPDTLTVATTVNQDRAMLQMFVQQVRGYCAAFDDAGRAIVAPAVADCDGGSTGYQAKQMTERTYLGGLDHSSPAVVGPSPYVPGTSGRPIVAFAGARDGMLHAFYVGGGTGYQDSDRGKELWAFLPPSQISRLATNSAMVDASINVIDAFADFPTDKDTDPASPEYGVIEWDDVNERPDGIREWRTVLLAAAGEGGSELFAMDVTNPLRPVLLWHVAGPTERDDRWDRPLVGNRFGNGRFGDASDQMDVDDYRSYALKWFDWDDGDDESETPTLHIPTDYHEARAEVLDELKTGRFNYRNLGRTYGTSIAKLWVGNGYRYVAYVATNAADHDNVSNPSGYKGLELFAIDLVTGEKLWQWQKRYTLARADGTVIADNAIPGRPAVADVDADGAVDRIYVGDMVGRIWELDAHDGRNLNYYPVKRDASATGPEEWVSLPLYGTPRMTGTGATSQTLDLSRVPDKGLAQQSLTSPIGLGRLTEVKEELAPYLPGRLAIAQGTMGVDAAITPFERGYVHVLPVYPSAGTRIPVPVDLTAARDPRDYGVLLQQADWAIELEAGERVYGMPRIVNNRVVFNTAFGSFTGDLSDSLYDSGNLMIAGKDGPPEATPNTTKAFGGVLIFQDRIIVSTASDIRRFEGTTLNDGNIAQRPFNRFTPAALKTFEPVINVVLEARQ